MDQLGQGQGSSGLVGTWSKMGEALGGRADPERGGQYGRIHTRMGGHSQGDPTKISGHH